MLLYFKKNYPKISVILDIQDKILYVFQLYHYTLITLLLAFNSQETLLNRGIIRTIRQSNYQCQHIINDLGPL